MPSNPPLTDEEISRKYAIPIGDQNFEAARRLSERRIDRVMCEAPNCVCPHCMKEFTATFYDLGGNIPENGNMITCERCERIIFVECITEDENYDRVYVTLTTDDPNKELAK